MFERYAEKARRVIFFARYEASEFGSPEIEPEFLLLGILRESEHVVARWLVPGDWKVVFRDEIAKQLPPQSKFSTSVDLPCPTKPSVCWHTQLKKQSVSAISTLARSTCSSDFCVSPNQIPAKC
jgi:hypothetical protein